MAETLSYIFAFSGYNIWHNWDCNTASSCGHWTFLFGQWDHGTVWTLFL